MQTRTTKSTILGGLLLGSALAASAVQVTFQVNMEYQISIGAFIPGTDTVEARGSFQSPVNWVGGFPLTNNPVNTNIYQGTYDVTNVAPGAARQFKFVIVSAASPAGAYEPSPNRTFALAASPQTLPLYYYNNAWAGTPIPVTFRVNMKVQQEIGRFDPLNHTVLLRGSFDNWGGGATLAVSATNINIYEGTVDVPNAPGSTIAHKFVISNPNLVWEGNVGVGGADRTFTLSDTNQSLPTVYFDNLTNNPGAGISVTFQVNLAVRTALGQFDPVTGTVVVAGPFNGWSTTATPLTNSPSNTNIYSGAVKITTSAPGSSIDHKFVLNGGTWENGANRAFVLASSNQTLPVRYFDDVSNLGLLAITNDAPNQFTLTWTGNPGVRLQSSTDLSTWLKDDLTLGANTATVSNVPPGMYFRLGTP